MSGQGVVYVVDDDADLADSLARLLRRQGHAAASFHDVDGLLRAYSADAAVCVVTDVMMADTTGFELAGRVRALDPACALLFITAWPRTADAVDAVRQYGGLDYLEKPIEEARLLRSVAEGLVWSANRRRIEKRTRTLTARERQVLGLIAMGKSNKLIAAELGLSPKTVEDHRAAINTKTGASGLADLVEIGRAFDLA